MKAMGQTYFKRAIGAGIFSMLLVSTAFCGTAMAQLQNSTSIADPGRASEEFRQPDLTPTVEPQISVSRPQPQGAPAGAEKITLTLKNINVEGNSVYSDAELAKLYNSKLGEKQTLADVYAIANDIMLKYRNDGYILTQVVVPPQTIDGGNVTLRVVEGFIDQVRVEQAEGASNVNMGNIEAYASQIRSGGALNVRDLERELLIINDLPGVSARSILSPSANVTGAADLLIVVDYDPVDGLIGLDNFGSRYLGPTQLTGAVTLNSMLGLNEAITAQTVLAPINGERELAYGALGYEQPIGIYGTKFKILGSVADTEPGWDLDRFNVRGHAWSLSAGLTHPIIRTRNENLSVRGTLEWRKVKSSNIIEPTRTDRIVALRLGGRYEFLDTLLGVAANTVDLEWSNGLDVLGASDKFDANLTRAKGDPQFSKVEIELQRLQRITNGVNLLLGARGQYTGHALLSSEEFGVGGVNSGRGYDPSEITGDEGIAAKVELQWKEPVALDSKFLDSYQLYTFYDVGTVWNNDATTSAQKRDSIASVGVGVRADLPYDVEAGLALAQPLTRRVQTRNDESPIVYFNVSKKF